MTGPNVLIFMSDQQQAGTVDPGHPCLTPHLDALAESGARLTRCYTPSPVCSPARASFLTGRLPHQHGMVDVASAVPSYRADLVDGLPSWSNRLHDAGYRVGYFGKWHIERSNDLGPYGFDSFNAFHEAGAEYRRYRADLGLSDRPVITGPQRVVCQPGYRDLPLYGVHDEPTESTQEHWIVNQAMDFLDTATAGDDPWAMMVSTRAPHEPYLAPREYFDRYSVEDLRLPDSFSDDLHDRPAIYRRQQSVWSDLAEDDFRTAMACYYALCSLVDDQVGRLLHRIAAAGQLTDTLIIYTADHGDLMGAHRLLLKGIPAFDEVYKVPAIVSWPDRIPAGQVIADLTQSHDLAETIARAGSGTGLEGHAVDLLPRLTVDPTPPRDDAIAELHGQRFSYTQRVVWYEHWKYVFNAFDFDELYDLAGDPDEQHNLAGDPEHADILRMMTMRMWRNAHRTSDDTLTGAQDGTYRYLASGPQSAPSD